MGHDDLESVEPSNSNVDNLLKTLKDGAFFDRKKAADDLALLPQSSEQVCAALIQAAQRDNDPAVRRAAIRALEMPVHFQYMQGQPRLTGILAEIKRQYDAQELAASQGDDDSGENTILRILKDIGQLIVGIISLFTLITDLPDTFRLICMAGVFVIGMAYIVQKYS